MERKAQILDAAAELLQSRSFSSFSYQDLSDRLGITKASLHHHFRTKEALGRALIDRSYAYYGAALKEISRKHSDPRKQLDSYLELMSEIAQSGTKICVTGVLQTEHNVISKGMRAGISRQHRFIHRWLSSVLEAGRRQGLMDIPGTPQDGAALICAAIQGALQNARAEGPRKFTAVVRQLRAGLRPRE